jgi:hypothetical protein
MGLLFFFFGGDGLSWTDPNIEKDCKAESSHCSVASMFQLDPSFVAGIKLYTFHAVIILYPSDSRAKTVDIRMVSETSDHVKQNFSRENVSVELYKEKIRTCGITVGTTDVGIINVLAIDVEEKGEGNEVLYKHKFR